MTFSVVTSDIEKKDETLIGLGVQISGKRFKDLGEEDFLTRILFFALLPTV